MAAKGGNDKLALFLQDASDVPLAAGPGFHLAFGAPDRSAVHAFHKAAVSNGGTGCGEPGLRERYSPTYYAAFVRDPDGHKLEIVHQ
jgi:catechol 2,3-dioxygenase-like lactoylglutathione lyase family enzyme